MTLCPGFGVGRGFAQFTIQNSKLKITYYEHQHSYHQGAGGAASGALAGAGAGTAGCRTAPPARGADPRGRFALDVPAGARGSECTFAARRGRPGRGVAAARRGRRRAVLCAGHLEGDPARRGLHEEFRRQIRLRRTPAAGPRGRARAGRRHPQTQRRDGKGAD